MPSPEQLRPRLEPANPGVGVLPEATPAPRAPSRPPGDLSIDVSSYVVDDTAPAALKAALPGLTRPFIGPGRSYDDLVNAAAAATTFLQRELGYYLGLVFLPEQDAAGGVVRLSVLEGRLDELVLAWDDALPVSRDVIEAYLARLTPGQPLLQADVERTALLINDLAGVQVRFEVRPGRSVGTATLVVRPRATPRLQGRVDLDANGSRFTGRNRLGALVAVASPAGRGDSLVANLLGATTGGLDFALLNYTLPLGGDGLRFGASVSRVLYRVQPEELAGALDLHGAASTAGLSLQYPLLRSRQANVFAQFGAEEKRTTDFVAGLAQRKTVHALQLSLTGDALDDAGFGGATAFEASLLKGQHNERPEGDNPAHFVLLRATVQRAQSLVPDRLALAASLRLQYSFDNLLSNEQFQLGGADRLRAYAPGDLTGDTGALLTLELRTRLDALVPGRVGRELTSFAFFDAGAVRQRKEPTAAQAAAPPERPFDNNRYASGAGIGLSWERPRDWSARATLAWPLAGRSESDLRPVRPRAYASLSKSF